MVESRSLQIDKKCVRTSFSRAAFSYDRFATLQRDVADCLLTRLSAQDYCPTMSVLDLGAGTGYCGEHLLKYAGFVVELDIAAGMLQFSRRRAIPNILHLCGDVESIPLADCSIGLIFSNLAFQWCNNLDRLFSETFRVLKPGGTLIFSSFGPETLTELRQAWTHVDDRTHVNNFATVRSVASTMDSAGLVECRVESEIKNFVYADVMQLMRELKGIGAHNMNGERPQGLTGRQRLSDMISAYQNLMPGVDIQATFEVFYGRATRPDLN